MADSDRDGGGERRVHQGEPTYDPADISQSARRSKWRGEQPEDSSRTARRVGESDEDYNRRLAELIAVDGSAESAIGEGGKDRSR